MSVEPAHPASDLLLLEKEILARLVSYPTVNDAENLALVQYVTGFLAAHGVVATQVPNEDGSKAALYARIGPEAPGGVVLSGHSDVVAAQGSDWRGDPFVLTERDGRLYGRGTCDMKGFVALVLAMVPYALAANLRQPIWIALSYDEEQTMSGAPPMIDHMLDNGLSKSAVVIVGEPSTMKVISAHKGIFNFAVHVRGHEVHSSRLDQGVSAVMVAADLIAWANGINRQFERQTPCAGAAAFEPPYTTIHVGQIEGGTAANITAKDCWFGVEFRVLPTDDAKLLRRSFLAQIETLSREMKSRHPDAHICAVEDFTAEGLTRETNGSAENLVRQITGENTSTVASYASEGGLFQSRGLSTVICGPGDVAQAHKPDEYISCAQLEMGHFFMRRLVDILTTEMN